MGLHEHLKRYVPHTFHIILATWLSEGILPWEGNKFASLGEVLSLFAAKKKITQKKLRQRIQQLFSSDSLLARTVMSLIEPNVQEIIQAFSKNLLSPTEKREIKAIAKLYLGFQKDATVFRDLCLEKSPHLPKIQAKIEKKHGVKIHNLPFTSALLLILKI